MTQDEQKPLRYSVLISKPQDFQPGKIAQALAHFQKIPAQDAAPAARKCWGIIEEDLEKKKAEELVACLKESGLESFTIPRGLLEDLPPLSPVPRLELEESGIRGLPKNGEEKRISYAAISLIAAIGFKKTTTSTVKIKEGPSLAEKAIGFGLMLSTGLPIKVGKKEKETLKNQEQSELVFFLDICGQEQSARLRVDAQNFDFSCLGERMEYNIFGNFKTLISEFTRRAPEAEKNRGASVILKNKSISAMGYESLNDLERESRWLLTLRALKR